jgi:putative flavoprotein involved in K+ transport
VSKTSIVIVGGGAAGLTTGGALKMQGLEPVILDKDEQTGGTWARRYERLHLHSVRAFSGLAHYPLPRSLPKYVPKDRFAGYLQDYARHFNLNVVQNCPVHKIRLEPGDNQFSKWLVESAQGTWQCDVVIVATGHYGTAYLPEWEGREQYQGTLLHSVDYKTGSEYAGKRVLVIGAGNSGSEIATDLAEQGASHIAISIRTAPPIAPRDWLGTPVQIFGFLLTPLPPKMADAIGHFLGRLSVGNLTKYGLPPAQWHPFTAHRVPIIDVGFIKELKRGRIQIKPNVAQFTPSGVQFENGEHEDYEVVVAATGFKTGLHELIEPAGLVDERGYPAYPSGKPTSYSGFYFMGYTESVRGHLFEANRDSRRLAKTVKGYLKDATASERLSPIKVTDTRPPGVGEH